MAEFTPLLFTIKGWLDEVLPILKYGSEWTSRLDEFFTAQIPQVWNDIKEAAKESAKTAIMRLFSVKEIILQTCQENEQILRSLLVKVGTKSLIKYGAQMAVKEASRVTAKAGLETSVKAGLETGVKAGIEGALFPIGITADFVQAGLEVIGYKDAGKKIGAAGNALSGAIVGFELGGPVGAGIGAAAGTAVWFVGEVAGNLFQL